VLTNFGEADLARGHGTRSRARHADDAPSIINIVAYGSEHSSCSIQTQLETPFIAASGIASTKMAPTVNVPRSTRATRSSTRIQTQKSQNNDLSTKPPKARSTGKVEKTRTKAKKAAKAQSAKKTAESKPKPDTDKEHAAEVEDNHASTPASTSAKSFTIDSELVNKPIVCHQYKPYTAKKTPKNPAPFVFTHGAGGTLSTPAVVNFCTGFSSTSSTPLLAFQGSSNLGARVRGFHACRAHLGSEEKDVVFGGRSMGARAAVMAATELLAEQKEKLMGRVRLMLVSYPLQGPKDVRDQILLDLPKETNVLFVIGDRDAMCPLDLLDRVREKMKARSRLIVVRRADHGMNVRPASKTQGLGEEAGRLAARWMSGAMENESDEALYVGEEE
jgi:predicted alpha/beta-hydrolase family hydrolase